MISAAKERKFRLWREVMLFEWRRNLCLEPKPWLTAAADENASLPLLTRGVAFFESTTDGNQQEVGLKQLKVLRHSVVTAPIQAGRYKPENA